MKISILIFYIVWLFSGLILCHDNLANIEPYNVSTIFDKRDEIIDFDTSDIDDKSDSFNENFEDVIIEDPGYEEDSGDDIAVSDTLDNENIETNENRDASQNDDFTNTMIEGFEGNREPLPFEEELKEEEKYFGKLSDDPSAIDKRSSISIEDDSEEETDEKSDLLEEDANYAEEVDETEDEDDSIENIDSDNFFNSEKRNFVADSDVDILGTNFEDEDDVKREAETEKDEFEPKFEDSDLKTLENSGNMNYVKLLSELDEEKKFSVDDSQKYTRDNIPKSQEKNIEERDKIFDDDSLIEQLTDNEESENIPKSQFEQFMDYNEDEKLNEEPKTCDDLEKKNSVLEYSESENNDHIDVDNNEIKDLMEDAHINFDCASCISMDSERDTEDRSLTENSKLSCPIGSSEKFDQSISRSQIEKNKENKISQRSDISNFVKTTDYLCNEKCKIQKRSAISRDILFKLSNVKLWRSLNPDIKYHRIPRSSVGILLDGNLQMDDYIINFVLNLFLLFSRDSGISLGVFRHCLKTIDIPIQSMMNPFSSYYKYLKDVQKLKEDTNIGPNEERNIHWALGDFSKTVEDNSKTIQTDLKIIILVTNGPFTGTNEDDLNLKVIKKQNQDKNILVFIVALGSRVNTCQLERTTLSSRIIIVHYLNQLLYGGKAQYRLPLGKEIKYQTLSMGGVISILQRKFLDSAKLFEPIKGEITYFKGGYVGWKGDKKLRNLIPLEFSIPAINTASENIDEADLIKYGVNSAIKKQNIPGSRRLGPSLRRRRTSFRRVGSGQMNRFRSSTQSESARNNLNRLSRRWYWTQVFPAIRKGVVKKANTIILVDTLGSSMINILQKLVHYTAIPFTYTLGKTSIFGMGSLKLEDYCKQRTFSRSEDIQRLVTTIKSSNGKTFSLATYILQLLRSPKLYSLTMNNVMILILTHRTIDFSQYRYIGRALQVANIKLYILGIGLRSENVWYNQLTMNNRIFTSTSAESFFTNQMFARFVRQLRMEVGASDKVTNLDVVISRTSNTLRSLTRVRPTSRNSGRNTGRNTGRNRAFSSGRVSRQGSRRRSTRRITRRPQRTLNRRRSKRDLILENYSKNADIYAKNKKSEILENDIKETTNINLDISDETKSTIPYENVIVDENKNHQKRNRISQSLRNLFSRRRGRRTPRRRNSRTQSQIISSSSRRRPGQASSRRRQTRRSPLRAGQSVGRNLRMLSRMIGSDGVVGPINFVVLVDGTFGTGITRVRQFLRDFLVIFQREGSYITLASYGISTHLYTLSTQFINAGQINTAVNRIKGVRSRYRSTGQALMASRRWFSSSTPDYPHVVLVIANGPSSDDFRVPASLLSKDGVKVIVIGNGNIRDEELLSIQSSSKLAFRTNLNNIPRVITSLLPLFQAICGKRKSIYSPEGRNYMNTLTRSRQWSWKSYGSGIRERIIASSEIASILDTTYSSDSIVKMFYNIINSFSIRSFHSVRTLGFAHYSSSLLARFRRYNDQTSTQLILLGLLSSSIRRRRIITRNRLVTRVRPQRTKRDLIDEVLSDVPTSDKRQKLGRLRNVGNIITPFGRLRKSASVSSSSNSFDRNGLNYGYRRPSKTQESIVGRRVNYRQQKNDGKNRDRGYIGESKISSLKNYGSVAPSSRRYRTSKLRNLGGQKVENSKNNLISSIRKKGIKKTGSSFGGSGFILKSNPELPSRLSDSSLESANNIFSTSSGLPGLYGTTNRHSSFDSLSKSDLSASQVQSASDTKVKDDLGYDLNSLRPSLYSSSKLSGSKGGIFNSNIQRESDLRGRGMSGFRGQQRWRSIRKRMGPRYISTRYRRFQRRRVCYTRSWRCLTLKLYRILTVMRARNLYTAYGPNKNKMVLLLLSGWPINHRRSSEFVFRRVSRNLTQMGVRLIIIVIQNTKTVNRIAMPVLRAASTFFAHGSWSEAQNILGRFQRSSLRRFGAIEKVSYSLKFSQYNMKKRAGFYVIPKYDSILPPIYESYLTTKYLISYQNLRTVNNWQQIIPGLRYEYIRGYLNVIIVVDVTQGKFGSIIRDAIYNLLRIFEKRETRFTLVIASRNTRVILRNYNAFSLRRLRFMTSRIKFSLAGLLGPRLGASLSYIRRLVIPNLRPYRRNLVVMFAQSSSADDVRNSANALKQEGAIISVFGVGSKVNPPELQLIASSGQLLATGEVSMLPLMLFRMQFSYSLCINGPDRTKRDISIISSSKIRPFATVFRGITNDRVQAVRPLGRINLRSAKRDEITNTTIPLSSLNETIIASSFKELSQDIVKAVIITNNSTNSKNTPSLDTITKSVYE